MSGKKKKKVCDEISECLIQGSLEGLTAMFFCLLTMWLVSIFTSLVSLNVMISTSAGVGVAFGAMRIMNLNEENLQ